MEQILYYKKNILVTYVPGEMLDQIMCKIFVYNLSRLALTWFYQLPSRIMDSFPQLVQVFINQFSSRKNIRKKAYDLFSVV